MQRATLHIPVEAHAAGDRFRVYGNVDSAGRHLSAIDYDTAITGLDAWPFWPLGIEPDEDREVVTPPLYHGRYQFAVRSEDSLGNVTEEDRVFEVHISSGPSRVRSLRHSQTTAGRPVFSFVAPAQMR